MTDNEFDIKNNLSVLLVDDNQINLFVLAKVFEQVGVAAESALSGTICLEKVKEKKYDLIVMDHMMPELDGIETLKLLKADPEFKTPVVALTANYGPDLEKKYRDAGFAEYLIKPATVTAIRDILKRYTGVQGTWHIGSIIDEDSSAESSRARRLKEFGFTEIDELIEGGVSESEYEELLLIFRDESKTKLPDCDKFYADSDLKNYAIIVHGLKNDAAMISDFPLSKIALKHEMESKGGNLEFVKENWPGLKEKWEETINRINGYFE